MWLRLVGQQCEPAWIYRVGCTAVIAQHCMYGDCSVQCPLVRVAWFVQWLRMRVCSKIVLVRLVIATLTRWHQHQAAGFHPASTWRFGYEGLHLPGHGPAAACAPPCPATWLHRSWCCVCRTRVGAARELSGARTFALGMLVGLGLGLPGWAGRAPCCPPRWCRRWVCWRPAGWRVRAGGLLHLVAVAVAGGAVSSAGGAATGLRQRWWANALAGSAHAGLHLRQ